MIRFNCPKCNAKLKAPIGSEGQKSKCRCGAGVVVPQEKLIVLVSLVDDKPSAILATPAVPQLAQIDAIPTATLLHPEPTSLPRSARRLLTCAALTGVLFFCVGYVAKRDGDGGTGGGFFGGIFTPAKSGPTRAKYARLRVGMMRNEAEGIMGNQWNVVRPGRLEPIGADFDHILAAAAAGPDAAWANANVFWTVEGTGVQLHIITRNGQIAGKIK